MATEHRMWQVKVGLEKGPVSPSLGQSLHLQPQLPTSTSSQGGGGHRVHPCPRGWAHQFPPPLPLKEWSVEGKGKWAREFNPKLVPTSTLHLSGQAALTFPSLSWLTFVKWTSLKTSC